MKLQRSGLRLFVATFMITMQLRAQNNKEGSTPPLVGEFYF